MIDMLWQPSEQQIAADNIKAFRNQVNRQYGVNAVCDVINNRLVSNTSALANREALELFRNLQQLND